MDIYEEDISFYKVRYSIMVRIGWILFWIGMNVVCFSWNNLSLHFWCWLVWEKLACGVTSEDRLGGTLSVQGRK